MSTVSQSVTVDRFFKAPLAKVWHAISQAESISVWFIQADFKPEVGYAYTFTHEETKVTGTVLEVDEPHRLVYTWNVGGIPGETTVTWTLLEKNGGTQLRIFHDGFESYKDSAAQMMTSVHGGWTKAVQELETYLQS